MFLQMQQIEIRLIMNPAEGWYAVSNDPKFYELFGTTTLPTQFTPTAKPEEVLARIRELNPDKDVQLA
jgi:hypothetical protein